MRYKILAAVAAVASLAGLCVTAALPASADAVTPAESAVKIVRVGYNAYGADTLANRWQEYIDIRNDGAEAVNVAGWATEDAWSHAEGAAPDAARCNTAVFAAAPADDTTDPTKFHDLRTANATRQEGLWLQAGDTIRVYTGGLADRNPGDHVHSIAINKGACGYHGHYLNNGGDTVHLVKSDGTEVASFSYAFDNGYYVR